MKTLNYNYEKNLEILKENLKTGDFNEIWDSYDERNYNSYNNSFLGIDFLVKWYNDRQYLAFHRSGDIRGNYTDFIDITESDILDEISHVTAIIEITKNGKTYTSYNNSNYDTFQFDEIEELELDEEKLEELFLDNE